MDYTLSNAPASIVGEVEPGESFVHERAGFIRLRIPDKNKEMVNIQPGMCLVARLDCGTILAISHFTRIQRGKVSLDISY